MNCAILIGRLTRDPEVRQANSGTSVCNYTLAVDRFKDGTDFIDCVCFGKQADFASQYFTKGLKVAVEGYIQVGSYKSKEGQNVKTFNVVVNRQEFCEPKKQDLDPFLSVPGGMDEEMEFQ